MFRIAACFATLAALASAAERQGVPFDGQGAYAVVEEGRRFDADAFSVACWVKPRQAPSAQTLVSRGRASALFTLYLYKNRVRMLVEYTKGQYAHANVPLPKPGAWTHYLGTYDGKAIRLYVNGKLGAEAPAVGRIARSDAPLLFGAVAPGERVLDGWLDDIRFWGRALSADKAAAVAAGQGPTQALLGRWTSDSLNGKTWRNTAVSDTPAVYHDEIGPRKADGYRGIWYSNQPQKNEYVYKYSGGLGTYCAKHIPFAIYAPKVNKTFFCYGGALKDKNELLHMVSYYDHETGTVPRPTIVLNKHTDDAHDNPVIALDAKGHIWIFSSSHGTSRPSYISVSRNPYDINSFERVLTTNFSYTQPWYLEGRGFLFLHTKYMGGRMLHQMTSPDGRTWTKPEPLAKIEMGHYQVSGPYGAKVGTAFNFHPKPKGLNWRTNLYYIETSDFGAKWTNAQGEALDLPLITPNNPALVHDFRAEGRNVYMKDIAFDAKGNPVILFITSKGWQAGPEMGP
ncbi:BNR-4 repeat-containing protein, partial [bacterium]|nr:BNR-4 repeat-containing protein [bacterium]